MKLYIKYMGSLRCKMMVKDELKKLGLQYVFVEPGMAEILDNITTSQRKELKINLRKCGIELMDEKDSILVEKVISVIVEMVHYAEGSSKIMHAQYVSEKLQLDYAYLDKIFSEVKGISIAQCIIVHRLERVKELMLYDELTLAEIASLLQYDSTEDLYKQFKTYTGLTPTFYKELKEKRRCNQQDL